MKNRFWFCTVLVFALLAVAISAETLQAVVRLPDNNPAPFATVTVGDKVFEADAEGQSNPRGTCRRQDRKDHLVGADR